MSAVENARNGPILPGSALAQMLDDYPVPGLSPGFAERVVAAAEARAAPLPPLRRMGRWGRWRLGRRIAIGIVSFGALATTAAATGLLERFDLPVPSAARVWASVTGAPPVAAAPAAPPALSAASDPAPPPKVEIDGLIDTPEELTEAFRRIDEVRSGRRAERREIAEQRIADAIERRRASGLPMPTPEEQARLRQRIEAAQALREQRADDRIRLRREELQRKVESGEALTREDMIGARPDNPRARERRVRYEQLRGMAPEARREALRQLPPAERRKIIERWRQRRAELLGEAADAAPHEEQSSDMPPSTVASSPDDGLR
jgi:hypothetical protein